MYNDIKTIEEKEQDFMQNLRDDSIDKEVAEKLSKEVVSHIIEQIKQKEIKEEE